MSTEQTVAEYKGGNIATLAVLLAGSVMVVKGAALGGGLIVIAALLAMPFVRWLFEIDTPTIVAWVLFFVGLYLLPNA